MRDFFSLPPWEQAKWLQAPKITATVVGIGARKQLLAADSARVAVAFGMVKSAGGGTGMCILPSSEITVANIEGFPLGASTLPIAFTYRDYFNLVQQEWWAANGGTIQTTVTAIEILLLDFPHEAPENVPIPRRVRQSTAGRLAYRNQSLQQAIRDSLLSSGYWPRNVD